MGLYTFLHILKGEIHFPQDTGDRSTLRRSAPGEILDGFNGPEPVNPTVISTGGASALSSTAMGR